MTETIATRLKRVRKAANITQAELAARVGLTQSGIGNIEAGTRGYGAKVVEIAKILGTTPDYLQLVVTAQTGNDNISNGPSIRSARMYPVISCVQAGDWTDIYDNFAPGDADEWRESHKDLGACGYVLRVQGDSMTGSAGAEYSFPAGFLLYVNPNLEALPGKFVIVRREGEQKATFKRYVMVDGDPYLEALNPMWPNRYLKLCEGDVFCGVVVHAGRDLP